MRRSFKVFIPEPEWESSHAILQKIAEVKTGKTGGWTENDFIEEMRDVDAVIITSQYHISRRVIENAKKLKVIAKYGSKPGIDNVDLDAATERGIVVCYTPNANSDSVAEHTITLILALLKRLYQTSSRLRCGRWRDKSMLGFELQGKTVGIIGFGNIGMKVAQKICGFGVKLIAFDPYVSRNTAKKIGVELVDLETLLKDSDIITIHAILTENTVHLISDNELRLVKKSVFIVNTARGAIVDEKALIDALKEGRIAGAALDVFEEEPPDPRNELLKLDNVLVTPHFASCTHEAYQRESIIAAEEVLRVLTKKKPKFAVNLECMHK